VGRRASDPVAAARAVVESEAGYDPVAWRKLAGQLGLQGLHVPERFGGSDGSYVELGIAFTELGRVMYAGPFLATVGLAANALLASADEAAMTEFLPQLADGSLIATVAMTEDTASGLPSADAVAAERRAGGYRLSGGLGYVLDGTAAGLILVPASTPEGNSLFAVRGEEVEKRRRWADRVDAVDQEDGAPAAAAQHLQLDPVDGHPAEGHPIGRHRASRLVRAVIMP